MDTNESHVQDLLQVYVDHPMREGDAALLLLDSRVCLELEQLADDWDEVICRSTAHVLRETAGSVVVGIARPAAALLPRDRRLWSELHDALRGSAVELLPLQALPAA